MKYLILVPVVWFGLGFLAKAITRGCYYFLPWPVMETKRREETLVVIWLKIDMRRNFWQGPIGLYRIVRHVIQHCDGNFRFSLRSVPKVKRLYS